MKKVSSICFIAICLFVASFKSYAQQGESMYGDAAKADVKMKYVYSLEEALKLAHQQDKPIFFNCFADWAIPCHVMNQLVFSDKEFSDYMNKHFINLFIDVSKQEAAAIVEKYNIRTFAHSLVLNSDGEILLRIVGGKRLPEFKNDVKRALSPKTSLVGTEKIYRSGKYDKEDLSNYLHALFLAGENEKFAKVSKEYFPMLSSKEYTKEENWLVFSTFITDRDCDLYKYLVEHKREFEENVGAQPINGFIEKFYYRDIARYALGSATYDAGKLLDLYSGMQKAGLPDSCLTYKLYHISKLRGEKKYDDLLEYLKLHGEELQQFKLYVDNSLELPEMTEEVRGKVVSYLRDVAKSERGTAAEQLIALANRLEHGEGIKFEKSTFGEALVKAKNENKLLFIDCYTSWCGPCRMMANQVFTLPEVGAFFNVRFINIKMDMEKGEGKDLAKKYNITGYPTMMLLDGDGNIVQRLVGARNDKELMRVVSEASNPETGYAASKAAYEKGVRTGTVIMGYTRAMKESGELNDAQIKEIIDDFFAGLSDDQFCDMQNWPLIQSEVKDVHSKGFTKILALHDELANQNSVEAVNKKIEKIVFPFFLRYLDSEVSEKEMAEVLSAISSGHYPEHYTLNMLANIMPIYHQNDKDAILDYYEKTVSQTKNGLDRLNVDLLLPRLMKGANSGQIEKAKQYVKSAMQNAGKGAINGYNSLMEALNEIKTVG